MRASVCILKKIKLTVLDYNDESGRRVNPGHPNLNLRLRKTMFSFGGGHAGTRAVPPG